MLQNGCELLHHTTPCATWDGDMLGSSRYSSSLSHLYHIVLSLTPIFRISCLLHSFPYMQQTVQAISYDRHVSTCLCHQFSSEDSSSSESSVSPSTFLRFRLPNLFHYGCVCSPEHYSCLAPSLTTGIRVIEDFEQKSGTSGVSLVPRVLCTHLGFLALCRRGNHLPAI